MIANSFKDFIEKKRLKYTRERECIYEKVRNLTDHFDGERLYEFLRRDNEDIARGTVFRTIPLLLESGVIQLSVGKGKGEFFERSNPRKGHHDHILCVGCGKVIEYKCKEIENLQETICKKYDTELLFHDHKLYVHCVKCRK